MNLGYVVSLVGGALIGLAAAALLLLQGRIAGVSGIVGGLFAPRKGDVGWRILFVAGLITGGVGAAWVAPGSVTLPEGSALLVVVAGVLVGFGTRLANGCTSGHGVCGIARRSRRSFVATSVFVATGAATVYLVRHVMGAVS